MVQARDSTSLSQGGVSDDAQIWTDSRGVIPSTLGKQPKQPMHNPNGRIRVAQPM